MAVTLVPAKNILNFKDDRGEAHLDVQKQYLRNPGFAIHAFFRHGLSKYEGKLATDYDFMCMRELKDPCIPALASELRKKGGIVLFPTMVISLPAGEAPDVIYRKQGGVHYSITIPKEFARVTMNGAAALLDFVKSPQNISSQQKTEFAVWMSIELPEGGKGALHALSPGLVPKDFFGIYAASFSPEPGRGFPAMSIYSGEIVLEKAWVLVKTGN